MGLPEGLVTGKTAKLPTDYKAQPISNAAERSGLEIGFLRLWRSLFPDLPAPERNFRFHQWKIDFCWPAAMLAVEIEGGAPGGGRHQRRGGFNRDAEKYREAVKAGWRLMRYTGDDLKQRPVQCVEEVAKILGKLTARCEAAIRCRRNLGIELEEYERRIDEERKRSLDVKSTSGPAHDRDKGWVKEVYHIPYDIAIEIEGDIAS